MSEKPSSVLNDCKQMYMSNSRSIRSYFNSLQILTWSPTHRAPVHEEVCRSHNESNLPILVGEYHPRPPLALLCNHPTSGNGHERERQARDHRARAKPPRAARTPRHSHILQID